MNEKKVVNVEKKSVNVVGLFFLFLIVVSGLAYGGYYYMNNKDFIDFYFPWEEKKENKEEKKSEVDKKTGFKKVKDTTISKREIHLSDVSVLKSRNVKVSVDKAIYDENRGYVLSFKAQNDDTEMFTMSVSNINIDGYQTDVNFSLGCMGQSSASVDVVIPNEILDKYRIGTIYRISLNAKYGNKNNTLSFVTEDTSSDKSIKAIEGITNIKNLSYSYYKIVEGSDKYSLYLLIENENDASYTYYINKMLVDGKEVDITRYNKKIYGNSKVVDVIEIPKGKLKNIKKVLISFFEFGNSNNIYQTNEVEFTL